MQKLPILILALSIQLTACARHEASNEEGVATSTKGSVEGVLEDGAMWRAKVPESWNGSLLLYSRGYSSKLLSPKVAPGNSEDLLLEAGYALVASSYPQTGWSVEQAIPSQLLALEAFTDTFTKPEKVIAWGSSMGGMVTAALAERHGDKLDGAITLCSSAFGALPMMNMAFDGAFALATLITPEEDFSPVGRGNNFDAVKAIMDKVNEARKTPLGRARVALAGVLGGIPSWTIKDAEKPSEQDYLAQEEQIAEAIHRGLFLPRGDQEKRAGGIFSGNKGVDYQTLLDVSGRKAFVEAMYRLADASLEEDLATLNRQPTVNTQNDAVQYMQDNFTPSGKLAVPVLTAHTTGDGMTSPALQAGYTELVAQKSGSNMVASVWIERAGHCTETDEERWVLVNILEERLDSGQWPVIPEYLNTLKGYSQSISFTDYKPFPVPRACSEKGLCAESWSH